MLRQRLGNLAMQKVNPDVEVIVCTAYSEDEEVENLLSAGALGCIKKPFMITHLQRQIRDAMSCDVD